jgi:hypothetical protein
MIDLGNGRMVAVHTHSGKVWLTSYNGCGVVNSLDLKQAKQLRARLFAAILELEKSATVKPPQQARSAR